MQAVDSALEIDKIKGVLSNFSWKLVKQVITEQEVTLTIQKDLNKNALALELDED